MFFKKKMRDIDSLIEEVNFIHREALDNQSEDDFDTVEGVVSYQMLKFSYIANEFSNKYLNLKENNKDTEGLLQLISLILKNVLPQLELLNEKLK